MIERAVVLCQGSEMGLEDLPDHISSLAEDSAMISNMSQLKLSGAISVQVGTPLKEVEDLLIRKTLEATDGDKNMTARLLGINSRTIYRRLGEKRED